ncbi:MAG: hypothetical protein HRU75_00540 [Planctomycetia bacterium]|nr:MAG: hypothetical protein HRU75_00540 [Planctomycetia bacterium]
MLLNILGRGRSRGASHNAGGRCATSTRIFRGGRAAALRLGGVLLLALGAAGCDSDIAKEFRAAAVPQLEAGINAIADGLISGAFAIADARDPTSSDTDATP